MYRIGIGQDIHRLKEGRPFILGGVKIDFSKGADGHSDADVLTHAITDAILGALCEGDIGMHFPDTDPRWKDADSLHLLSRVVWLADTKGYEVVNIDSTVMLERPKLRPYIEEMRRKLAQVLNIDPQAISVKAKTNEGFGEVGEGRAVSAQAIVLLQRI
jgi:2-C-methyl-D-erythritol 2,4-cyclodiphosphate synthase